MESGRGRRRAPPRSLAIRPRHRAPRLAGAMTGRRTHVLSGSKYEELAGYARAVVVDDRIFVSGTVGVDFETGAMPETAESQASRALDTIERALAEAGSGLHDVVRGPGLCAGSGRRSRRVGRAQGALRGGPPCQYDRLRAPCGFPIARVEIEVDAIRGSG